MRGMTWDRNDVRVYHYDTNFIINQSLITEVKYPFLKSINDMPINMNIRAMLTKTDKMRIPQNDLFLECKL